VLHERRLWPGRPTQGKPNEELTESCKRPGGQPRTQPDDLIDQLSIFTVPIVLGDGKKLFADGSAPQAFRLTGSRVSSSGVLIGRYECDGDIEIGDVELDSPSELETARRERMEREG
jgi:hypothetical protein